MSSNFQLTVAKPQSLTKRYQTSSLEQKAARLHSGSGAKLDEPMLGKSFCLVLLKGQSLTGNVWTLATSNKIKKELNIKKNQTQINPKSFFILRVCKLLMELLEFFLEWQSVFKTAS